MITLGSERIKESIEEKLVQAGTVVRPRSKEFHLPMHVVHHICCAINNTAMTALTQNKMKILINKRITAEFNPSHRSVDILLSLPPFPVLYLIPKSPLGPPGL